MTNQNYCMIDDQTMLCANVVMWDGNPDTWQPPTGYTMLVQATTPSKVWEWDVANDVWVLGIQVGQGGIGFTWDGTYLITNDPQPTQPLLVSIPGQPQAEVTGATVL